MKAMTVTEFARNLSATMSEVEYGGEEVLLLRNNRQVARIVPEATHQTALEAMGDLYRTLDHEAATALVRTFASRRAAGKTGRKGTLKELRNPWPT